jgi:hypothetical protein
MRWYPPTAHEGFTPDLRSGSGAGARHNPLVQPHQWSEPLFASAAAVALAASAEIAGTVSKSPELALFAGCPGACRATEAADVTTAAAGGEERAEMAAADAAAAAAATTALNMDAEFSDRRASLAAPALPDPLAP